MLIICIKLFDKSKRISNVLTPNLRKNAGEILETINLDFTEQKVLIKSIR